MSLRLGCVVAALGVALTAPAAAWAQTSSSTQGPGKPAKPPAKPKTPSFTGPKWEVTFLGGWATGVPAPTGAAKTPPDGASFVMADGATTTRAVTSWFYGDGGDLLNQVLQLRAQSSSSFIKRLDEGSWPAAGLQPGVQAGARIGRRLNRRIFLEGGFDIGFKAVGFDDEAKGRFETTRQSFESAFTTLANSASALVTAATVSATTTPASSGPRLTVHGIVEYRGDEKSHPFVLAGVGMAKTIGDVASMTLTGTYRFTLPNSSAVEETDTVRISYTDKSALVYILGGGFMRDLSAKSAFRVEIRLMMSASDITARVDAAPSSTATSPGGVLVLNATNPGLQFSSMSAIKTTLSGVALQNFEAYTGNRRALQWVISAGYVRRF